MAAVDLFEALDRGFAVVSRVAGVAGDPEEARLALAHAQVIVGEDPDSAACAIFALAVEQSEDANLAWLLEEWKLKRREQLGLPDELGPTTPEEED